MGTATKEEELRSLWETQWETQEKHRHDEWLNFMIGNIGSLWGKDSGRFENGLVDMVESGLGDIIAESEQNEQVKAQLTSLVLGGCPHKARGKAWRLFLDLSVRKHSGYYQLLWQRALGDELATHEQLEPDVIKQHTQHTEVQLSAENSTQQKESTADDDAWRDAWLKHGRTWLLQIEKDLPRTFPGHSRIHKPVLRRILAAYAMHKADIGYCQGMNFIAAVLSMFLSEEDAFYGLAAIVEEVLEGYYSQDMMAIQVDQLVFKQLVAQEHPEVAQHLDDVGADIACVFAQWFLCAFVNFLPLEACMRVWDLMLYTKSVATLFQVALALVHMYAPALLATADVLDAFSVVQSMAKLTHDQSGLISLAVERFPHVNKTLLDQLRAPARAEVEQARKDMQAAADKAEAERSARQAAAAAAAAAATAAGGAGDAMSKVSVVKKLLARIGDKARDMGKGGESGSRGGAGSDVEEGVEVDSTPAASGNASLSASVHAGSRLAAPASVSPLLPGMAAAGDVGGIAGQAEAAEAGRGTEEDEGTYVPPEVPLFPEPQELITLSPSDSAANIPDIDDLMRNTSMRHGSTAAKAGAAQEDSFSASRPQTPPGVRMNSTLQAINQVLWQETLTPKWQSQAQFSAAQRGQDIPTEPSTSGTAGAAATSTAAQQDPIKQLFASMGDGPLVTAVAGTTQGSGAAVAAAVADGAAASVPATVRTSITNAALGGGASTAGCSVPDSPVLLSKQTTTVQDDDGSKVIASFSSEPVAQPRTLPAKAAGSASSHPRVSKAMLLALEIAATPFSVRQQQQAGQDQAQAQVMQEQKQKQVPSSQTVKQPLSSTSAGKQPQGATQATAAAATVLPTQATSSLVSFPSTTMSGAVDDSSSQHGGDGRNTIDEWVTVDGPPSTAKQGQQVAPRNDSPHLLSHTNSNSSTLQATQGPGSSLLTLLPPLSPTAGARPTSDWTQPTRRSGSLMAVGHAALLLQPLGRENHTHSGLGSDVYAADAGIATVAHNMVVPQEAVEELCRREGVSRLMEQCQTLSRQVESTRDGEGETQVERTTHTLSKRVSELQSALAAAWRMSGDAHSRSDPGGLAGGQAASGNGLQGSSSTGGASALSADVAGTQPANHLPPALTHAINALKSDIDKLMAMQSIETAMLAGYQDLTGLMGEKVVEMAALVAERDMVVEAVNDKLRVQTAQLAVREDELADKDDQIQQLQMQLIATQNQLSALMGAQQAAAGGDGGRRAGQGSRPRLFGDRSNDGAGEGGEGGGRGAEESKEEGRVSRWFKTKLGLKSTDELGGSGAQSVQQQHSMSVSSIFSD